MKTPRFATVFLCAACAAFAISAGKALAFGGLRTLPSLKMVVFAACNFGLVAAMLDWALLRDLFPRRDKKVATLADAARPQEPAPAESQERPGSPHPDIQRARLSSIVFREIFPPRAQGGLSFYGGVPIGPSHLAWPKCRNKPGHVPLSFLMQWDCSELARQDATGLVPSDGVLYLFTDLTWGDPLDFEFVHAPGPTEGWHALAVPPDLPPIFGNDGAYHIPYCSPEISKEGPDVPRLMPKWPFAPAAFAYPEAHAEGFWAEAATGEALLKVQDPGGDAAPDPRLDHIHRPFARPFAAFPQDYAAVRAVAAKVLHELRHSPVWLLRELPEPERQVIFDGWRKQAAQRYASAAAHDPAAKLEQNESDEIWNWIESLEPIFKMSWGPLLEACANISFGLGSEAVEAVPDDLVAACQRRHRLAFSYLHEERPDRRQPDALKNWDARKAAGLLKEVRSVHAPCPNHMFGPPSFVQGYVEEYLAEWVLLLELSTRDAIGHYLGDGVLQFLIRPGDLKERRFEKVELVASAY